MSCRLTRGSPRRPGVVVAVAALVASCGAGSGSARPAPRPKVLAEDRAPGLTLRVACSPGGPERCGDARDGNCNGLIDEGCGLRTGLIQFVIAWEAPTADVNLRVTDASGELVEVGRQTVAGFVKERDCPGARGECGGQNVENVVLENTPLGRVPRGTYRVKIRLEKLGNEDPPIRVELGARVGPKVYSAEVELLRAEDQREITFVL